MQRCIGYIAYTIYGDATGMQRGIGRCYGVLLGRLGMLMLTLLIGEQYTVSSRSSLSLSHPSDVA